MAARDETNDPTTFRLNRVVAWLEGMSRARYAAELGDEHAGDAAPGEPTRRAAPAFDDFAPSSARGGRPRRPWRRRRFRTGAGAS